MKGIYPSMVFLFSSILSLPPSCWCWGRRRRWCGVVSDARAAACHGEERTCGRLTCGAVADRRARSPFGESSRAKNSALAEEGEEPEKSTAERNRNFGAIFTPRVPLLHPRRDFLPVKTFSAFFFFIYRSIFIRACTLPWLLISLLSCTRSFCFCRASYSMTRGL